MKERKLYSLTGKLIVFLLLIVFAASALFGGIQTLMLSSVGLTPNAAAKKYAFEETTACGTLVQRQLHNVMSYYNDMSKFGTNGRYDGTKEIDYRAFATDGEGSGGISTTYTIDQLVKMYDDGSSADLNEVAAYTADNYATNDAGIDKEAYLAYEDGTDVSQETEETDVAALTEEVSAADAETFDSFSPDGEVYFPSDNAVKSLKEKKIDPADVSSQFLYLYDQGMSLETQKKGIKIPKKLKVVGYDGLDFTRFLTPELTTVCQNVPEIAKRSVDTIIRMIDGKKIEEMEQIVDVTFRKGEST